MNIRQTKIAQFLGENRVATVTELARQFDVSLMTIRRDLAILERQGVAVRTRGGAVLQTRLPAFTRITPAQGVTPRKVAIGRLAATLVRPNTTVMVDSGSTALQVALHLPRDKGVTLVTSSLEVAQALYGSGVKVVMLGGQLRDDRPSVYGPLTEQQLKGLRVDMLFVGCDGADAADGFFMSDLLASSLEREMVQIAQTVVVVTESVKFQRTSFSLYIQPHEAHYLVTDPDLSEKDRQTLQDAGIQVLIAVP